VCCGLSAIQLKTFRHESPKAIISPNSSRFWRNCKTQNEGSNI
jgi:hypothetical protein